MGRAGNPCYWMAVAAMVAASPAAAQDLIYSNDATQSCLNSAADGNAQIACIGLSASACMSANDAGGSTVGMGGCLSYEAAYWDSLLNAYYQAAVARAKNMDVDNLSYGGPAQVENTLREMQRAWIPFRDAACDFERSQWGNGTGGGPATLDCLMRLTGRQALDLGRFGYGQ